MSKKVAFINSVIAVLLICLGIVFGCLMCGFNVFEKDKQSVNDLVTTQSMVLNTADDVSSVYSYTGSNIYVPFSAFNRNLSNPATGINSSVLSGSLLSFDLSSNQFVVHSNYLNASPLDYVFTDYFRDNSWYRKSFNLNSGLVDNLVFFGYCCSSNFNFNVVKIDFRHSENFFNDTNFWSNDIIFYDNNNNSFYFAFAFWVSSNYDRYSFDNRSYYLSSSFSDNEYYIIGYDAGYSAGDSAGRDVGYNVGYNAGYSVGDTVGYNRGLSAVNTYTFNNLFGAMFDVPVQIITGLLNFNFLGVNLFEFATGIITFVLVVRIVGFILGKK